MKKRIFCATIIGLFAADQSFCTQEAPTSSLFEVSSSSPSVNKATMTRRNSMISYQKAIATSRKIFTFDEFLRNIDRFAQDNEWKSAATDISGAYNEANSVLHVHSDKFGCKKMIHKNDANNVIYTVDISWPAVKQYAEKAIEKENLSKTILSSLLRFNKNESVMLDLSDLNKILKYTKDIKENESEQGVTAISSDQINALEKLCIGKNRLFCIDKLEESYQENFREIFKCAIKNYTGFQRIMSLLAMFILNTNKDRGYAIVDGARPIAIEAIDGESSHYSQSEKTIRLQRRYLDLSDSESVYVFVHEATHAFHYMLCPDGFDDFLSLSVYASLNAENANFLQLFFPALAKEVMDPIVTIVENKMGGNLPVGTIKEDIGNKGKSTAWLYEIFKFLINAGFANVVFDKDVLDKDGGDNFKLSNILTSTHIARAIYILAFAFGKEENNKWLNNTTKLTNPILENGEAFRSLWKDSEEMLTIFGGIPLIIDGKTVVIQDRQNGLMYDWRSCASSIIPSNDITSKIYHQHRCNAANIIVGFVENSLKLLGVDICYFGRSLTSMSAKAIFPTIAMFRLTDYEKEEVVSDNLFSVDIFGLIKYVNFEIKDTMLQNLSICNNKGCNVLTYAILYNTEMAKKIIKYAKENGQTSLLSGADNRGNAPLITAVSAGNCAIVDMLLEAGADCSRCGSNGCNALTNDIFFGTEMAKKIIKYAKKNGPSLLSDVDDHRNTPLIAAVSAGNCDIVDMLLKAGADCSICGDKGYNALTFAIFFGIEMPKKVEYAKKNGILPRGIDMLLKAGANMLLKAGVSICGDDGNAIIFGIFCTKIAKKIIGYAQEKGLTSLLSGVDNLGNMPLIAAIRAGNCDIVDMLLQAGADCSICSNDGNALTFAIAHANNNVPFYMIRKIIIEYAKENRLTSLLSGVDNLGNTPLIAAIRAGNCDIVDMLLQAGADCSICSNDGNALTFAIAHANNNVPLDMIRKKIIGYAKENGLTSLLSGVDNLGNTPLIAAIRAGNCDIVDMLLKAGADCSICDDDGHNALTFALLSGTEMAEKIIEYARTRLDLLTKPDGRGRIPMSMVQDNGYDNIDELLEGRPPRKRRRMC